jgi:glycosyltransferase involved in cell wall biosynthesis
LLEAVGVKKAKVQVLRHFTKNITSEVVERNNEPLNLLYLGRLSDEKGCLLLPEAVRLASEVSGRRLVVWIAGDGPLRDELRFRLAKANVAAEFFGWVDASRRDALLRMAHLLLFPSVWPEPFGLAGLEAAAFGVPAVAFRSGGVLEWLSPGRTGELADEGPPTAKSFAGGLVRALRSPEHLRALGREALSFAQSFSALEHVRNLELVLREVSTLVDADAPAVKAFRQRT